MNKTTIVENQTKDNSNTKLNKRIKDERPKKKDEKSVDNVLKALDSLGTTEEKLGAMCQKYAEMFNDHRLLQTAVKQAERKNTVLQKEKEQLQAEHSKAILTRSRLENLCRELQRQNKAVKEECMLKMREEGEKKREVAAKFHSMLSEIGSLLAQNNDKNAKLRDDNLDMSMRLKSVCDQFEKKEQHVESLAKQMQLEMQLADAKLAKAKMEMDIEKETLQKEKQQLLIELSDYKRKLCEMKASELALREQITMYSEKYEEFHKALLQSNSAIGEFKAEMERMTKHIRRLEKETATWKSRYDAAQRTLAEVTQGKIRADEALGLSQRRLTALQGICRGLQDQCRQLRGETRRDSQADEDYKRLEAQIKEVERDGEGLDMCTSSPDQVVEPLSTSIVESPKSTDSTTVAVNETEKDKSEKPSAKEITIEQICENGDLLNEIEKKDGTTLEEYELVTKNSEILKEEQLGQEQENIEVKTETSNDEKIDSMKNPENNTLNEETREDLDTSSPSYLANALAKEIAAYEKEYYLDIINDVEDIHNLKAHENVIQNNIEELPSLVGMELLNGENIIIPGNNRTQTENVLSEKDKEVPNNLCIVDSLEINSSNQPEDSSTQPADLVNIVHNHTNSTLKYNNTLLNLNPNSPNNSEETSVGQIPNEASNEQSLDGNKIANDEANQSKNKKKRKSKK